MVRRLRSNEKKDDARSKTNIKYTPSKHRLIYYDPYASQYTYSCTNRNAERVTEFNEINLKHDASILSFKVTLVNHN